MNPLFNSATLISSPLAIAFRNSNSPSRPHSGRARRSSNTEMPSVSQRGTRWFDICSVMTCASSCHSVSLQLKSPGGCRARGESSVTTLPKQTPSAPIMPGSPSVRTAKSSCFGNASMRIGPVGVKPYCFDSVRQRLVREPEHRLLHHAHLVGMQPNDQVAILDRLELVERVEHLEEVVRNNVVAVQLERLLQRGPRRRLVAGAQQVQAEVALGPRAVRLDLHRLAGPAPPPLRTGSGSPSSRPARDRSRHSAD